MHLYFWRPGVNCHIIEVLCFLNHFFNLKQKYFVDLSFKVAKMPCFDIKVLSKNLHGYGTSRKLVIINKTSIRLSTPGAQNAKNYNTVWYVTNCCLCYCAKRLQIGLNLVPQ